MTGWPVPTVPDAMVWISQVLVPLSAHVFLDRGVPVASVAKIPPPRSAVYVSDTKTAFIIFNNQLTSQLAVGPDCVFPPIVKGTDQTANDNDQKGNQCYPVAKADLGNQTLYRRHCVH